MTKLSGIQEKELSRCKLRLEKMVMTGAAALEAIQKMEESGEMDN